MIVANGDGTTVKATVYFRGVRPLNYNCPSNVDGTLNCSYRLNLVSVAEKATMNTGHMLQWINTQFAPLTNPGFKSILLLDSYKCHDSAVVHARLEELNTVLIIIPPGCTSFLAPLD